MILIIGGSAQGKHHYATTELCILETDIIDHLQNLIREDMIAGKSPKEHINSLMEENPNVCLICDEIGSGIVPMEQFERDYRDMTGEICCELARRAKHVYRVNCGIGQVLN